MKILFLECVSKSENSIDAHVRNCYLLQEYLKTKEHICDLEFNNTMNKNHKTDYDVIIVSYASFYCNFEEMKRIMKNNKKARLYWITNEYDLLPNGSLYKLFKERNAEIIANFESSASKIKVFKRHHMLNLNLLFFQQKEEQNKKYSICYYGTFRKNRTKYFKKYINNKEFYLSSSSKNFKKFKSIGCNFKPIKKMKWGENKDTLGLFKYSLYIEDEYTHNNFNNLANRFYEALSNDTVVLFDRSCINTLKKSEIAKFDYSDFIIDDLKNINDRDYIKDVKKQNEWKQYIEDCRRKMLEEFEEIIKGDYIPS